QPRAGLVVIQEAFGVNDHIKDVTRRFADEGYLAVAPDMFHRFEQRTMGYDEMSAAIGQVRQMNAAMIMNDVEAAIGWLKGQDVAKIGLAGFCFGGYAAFLAATRSADVAAAVGFYGAGIANPRNPEAPIKDAEKLRAPVLLLFGEQDQMNPLDQVDEIEATLSRLGKEHEIVRYPEAGHGFFCDARGSYDAGAAADAWRRTLAFLDARLG